MVSEKLYRNTLMTFHSILKPCTKSVLNFPTYFNVSGLFLKRWQCLDATYCASQKHFGLWQELILKDARVSVIEIFSQMQNLPNIKTCQK